MQKTQINPICITALIPGFQRDGSYLPKGKAPIDARFIDDDIAQSLAIAAASGANSVSQDRVFTPDHFAIFIQAANKQPMTLVTIPAYPLTQQAENDGDGMQPYVFSAVAMAIGEEAQRLGQTYPGLPTKASVHVVPMNSVGQHGYGNPSLAEAA